MKPILLDLYCGAGGAAMGYHRAGFDVVGVDIKPQPRYPFELLQIDALNLPVEFLQRFDSIHASPPCQKYSRLAHLPNRNQRPSPDLVGRTRTLLTKSGKPWVMENVVGAPLYTIIELCGMMFGLKVYRHRRFESNIILFQPGHPHHTERVKPIGSKCGYYGNKPSSFVTVAGNLFSLEAGALAMGIDWMKKKELAQAIPPAYTEYIGKQLIKAI